MNERGQTPGYGHTRRGLTPRTFGKAKEVNDV